jgi:hypothetical protein
MQGFNGRRAGRDRAERDNDVKYIARLRFRPEQDLAEEDET